MVVVIHEESLVDVDHMNNGAMSPLSRGTCRCVMCESLSPQRISRRVEL
jgi:hypothetical protein